MSLFLLELDVDKEENSRLGVYWLIKASEQGNIEATNILKQCLETGQGKTSTKYITFLTSRNNSKCCCCDHSRLISCFCFVCYVGITEHNYVDVKSCLSMSQDEKLVRRAAREMFSR
jgi:wolfamin